MRAAFSYKPWRKTYIDLTKFCWFLSPNSLIDVYSIRTICENSSRTDTIKTAALTFFSCLFSKLKLQKNCERWSTLLFPSRAIFIVLGRYESGKFNFKITGNGRYFLRCFLRETKKLGKMWNSAWKKDFNEAWRYWNTFLNTFRFDIFSAFKG